MNENRVMELCFIQIYSVCGWHAFQNICSDIVKKATRGEKRAGGRECERGREKNEINNQTAQQMKLIKRFIIIHPTTSMVLV